MGVVPFFRPPDLSSRVLWRIEERLREGKFSNVNEFVHAFEERIRRHFRRNHAVATSSGAQALLLATSYIKKRYNPKTCALPTFTDPSCLHALRFNGIRPVWKDIEPDTWTMVPDRTGADMAMPVNIFGQFPVGWADAPAPVVYDDAHGIGVGLMGLDPACVSFAPSKMITSIEGGAVVTDDDACADHVRGLRDKMARMSELHAAVGLASMDTLPDVLSRRKRLLMEYVHSLPDFVFQKNGGNVSRISITFEHPSKRFRALERSAGEVEFRTYYKPLQEGMPVADDVASRVLQLPAWHGITSYETDRVTALLKSLV